MSNIERYNNKNNKMELVNQLAQSNMLPRQYQKNPGNLMWALEYAEALQVHPMTVIGGIHVIEGKPTASAQLIGGLVRRAGHVLRVSFDRQTMTATAQVIRADDPSFTFESVWTLDRAKAANLTGKGVWKSYPDAMLKARAITEVARDAAPETLMGVIYTPEELGAEVELDADGEQVPVQVTAVIPDNMVPASAAKRQLVEVAGGDVDVAKAVWGERGSAPISTDDLAKLVEGIRIAMSEADADVVDAEIVEDGDPVFDNPDWNETTPDDDEGVAA